MTKITKEFINMLPQLKETKDKCYWDDELKGFGIRIQGKSVSYIILYTNQYGKQRKLKICRIDKMTPAEARKEAKEHFADIIKGIDPANEKNKLKNALTVSELCDLYWSEGTSHKKQSTLNIDRGRIEHHIKPLIGKLPVISLTRGMIETMMNDIIKGDKIQRYAQSQHKRGVIKIKGGLFAASRTISLFSAILEFAKNRNIIKENISRGIKRPKDNQRQVFLTLEEIKVFGQAFKNAECEHKNKNALNIIKLLLLTGCRKNEIASLKWNYIDIGNQCFRFPDTKTGQQNRPFGIGALNLIKNIQIENSEWVFPATTGTGHFMGTAKIFNEICDSIDKKTGKKYLNKPNMCIHALRHTFASVGADLGYTELTLAGLLGHSLRSVTNHYSHNIDKSLILSADVISSKISTILNNLEDFS